MPSSTIIITVVIVILALGFDFINGFHDTANAIATSVSTRVLTAREAIIMSATLNLVGALISVKVATTVGSNIIKPEFMPQIAVVAMLISSICWNLITWYFGIPSSSSHALIGSLLGAGITYNASFSIVQWGNFMSKIVLWLFLSPIIGFIIGYIFMKLLNLILSPFKPKNITKFFSKAQIVSAAAMAFNHGSNDAQKSMGIITMALVSGGLISTFHVEPWVKISCALSMAAGTSIGGWRIIKTMGVSMGGKMTPVNGFAAETGAAAIIFAATMLHAPVSTTQIISTSIMGVGASKRFSSIRWGVAKNIVWAWVITIPICALFASGLTLLIKMF